MAGIFTSLQNKVGTFGLTSKRRRWLIPMLAGLLVTALMYGANISKPVIIERLGNLVFDSYQRVKPRIYDETIPVRIIDIDDESLSRIGQWPWPRTTLAKMNDRLVEAGAVVIAYDIVFAEEDRTSPENILSVLESNPAFQGQEFGLENLASHDDILAQSFQQSHVIGSFLFTNTQSENLPKPVTINWAGDIPYGAIENYNGIQGSRAALQSALSGEGFITINPDPADGVVRSAPLLARVDERIYPSLSIEALRVAQGAGFHIARSSNSSRNIGLADGGRVEMSSVKTGDFLLPTNAAGEVLLYYTTPQRDKRFVPAWKIVDDSVPVSEWATKVQGQILFVGTSAVGLKDIKATPMEGAAPGVAIHAQIVEQALTGEFIKRPYSVILLEALTVLGFGLALSLILPHLGAAKGAIIGLIMALGAMWVSWYAFSAEQTLINPVYPLLTVLACYIVMTLLSFYFSETDRSRIRNAFSMYLSPAMVKRVSDDPTALTLGGEDRNITILFLDIRSFSKISEQLSPSEVTQFLNLFLTPMTDILQQHNATIDKYIGDAIVAFWNAPLDDEDHEKNAARAVLAMSDTLKKLNKKYNAQDAIKWPDPLSMGIGLNTGICTVGNLGSEQRFSYSMIGDAANLASRIEGRTKYYGLELLIGSETAKALKKEAVLEVDRIQVVGRRAPETIYTLLGDESVAKEDSFIELKGLQNEFLKAYRAEQLQGALKTLKSIEALAVKYELSSYYRIMAERIETFKTNPPEEGWDGVYIAQNK